MASAPDEHDLGGRSSVPLRSPCCHVSLHLLEEKTVCEASPNDKGVGFREVELVEWKSMRKLNESRVGILEKADPDMHALKNATP